MASDPLAARMPRRVLITGAAGAIGSCLRDGLGPLVDELVLTDVRELEPAAGERFVQAELTDREAVMLAARGVDAVVHLGAVPTEVRFEELVGPNLVGTFNVFEAARLCGVSRMVFASSNHATGFYPVDRTLRGDEPTRPDGLYGVTKVYGEALGRLYVDKFGLDVVCVRIGSFAERPRQLREFATWLSHGDAVRLFAACLSARAVGFRVVYGASANAQRFWDLTSAFELGYEPRDDAERYAGEVGGDLHELQGGAFTARDAGGWA
ncbi:MAG TPA: NAD(P)-dependent oxidoreductase [Solirubrobacteraceae bacterium]